MSRDTLYDPDEIAPDELTSDVIDTAMAVLHDQYGQCYAGLEPTVLGQCVKNKSMLASLLQANAALYR